MGDFPAYKCICQNCETMFVLNRYMKNVINMDEQSDTKLEFLNGTLNSIECPECKTKFTFEIPAIVFSCNNKYAIKVSPSADISGFDTSSYPPFLIMPHDFKYREVTFLVEALEKVNVFENLLDDRYIEYIKLTAFEDKDTIPFREVNMVFTSKDRSGYKFAKLNCNNEILGNYTVVSDKIPICIFNEKETQRSNQWQKINRFTIEEYIKKEI